MSRAHAVLLRLPDGFFALEQKPSTNGTFVDDRRLKEGQKVRLSPGCKIRFGAIETTFQLD